MTEHNDHDQEAREWFRSHYEQPVIEECQPSPSPADSPILREMVDKIREYLRRPSQDGQPIRQKMREELSALLARYDAGER